MRMRLKSKTLAGMYNRIKSATTSYKKFVYSLRLQKKSDAKKRPMPPAAMEIIEMGSPGSINGSASKKRRTEEGTSASAPPSPIDLTQSKPAVQLKKLNAASSSAAAGKKKEVCAGKADIGIILNFFLSLSHSSIIGYWRGGGILRRRAHCNPTIYTPNRRSCCRVPRHSAQLRAQG